MWDWGTGSLGFFQSKFLHIYASYENSYVNKTI